MNVQTTAMLEQLLSKVTATAWRVRPPVVESAKAPKPSEEDDEDPIDVFLSDLVDHVMAQYDATDGEAADTVFACIDELVAAGTLSEIPEEGADEKETSAWIGRATTKKLSKKVSEFAKKNAEKA